MNVRYGKNKRKAISPVLATVILIAITLIAAIAIAGFVFGLFGSFTSSANVSASVTTCTWSSSAGTTCDLTLSNSGSANTGASSCSLTYGGATTGGVVTLYTDSGLSTTTTNIKAGTTTYATCVAAVGVDPTAGAAITGSLSTTNGGAVPFTGTSDA